MATYAGNKAVVYLLSGASTASGILTLVPGADSVKYQVGFADYGKRFWDPSVAVTIKANAVVKNIGPLSTDADRVVWAGGGVWFRTVQTGPITIENAKYFTATPVAECKEWNLSIDQDMVDSTPMGANWKRSTPTLQSASGSLSKWFADDAFGASIRAGTMVGISLEVTTGAGGTHPQAANIYAYLSSQAIKAAVDGMVEEDLDFQAIMDVGFTQL
jgi:hypothetical protein